MVYDKALDAAQGLPWCLKVVYDGQARVYLALGDVGRAKELFERVRVALLEEDKGRHPDLVSAMTNIAICVWHSGQVVEARRLFVQARDLSVSVQGEVAATSEIRDIIERLNSLLLTQEGEQEGTSEEIGQ